MSDVDSILHFHTHPLTWPCDQCGRNVEHRVPVGGKLLCYECTAARIAELESIIDEQTKQMDTQTSALAEYRQEAPVCATCGYDAPTGHPGYCHYCGGELTTAHKWMRGRIAELEAQLASILGPASRLIVWAVQREDATFVVQYKHWLELSRAIRALEVKP